MWRLPIILRVTTADISNYIHFNLGSAFADICLLMIVCKQDYTKTDGFVERFLALPRNYYIIKSIQKQI